MWFDPRTSVMVRSASTTLAHSKYMYMCNILLACICVVTRGKKRMCVRGKRYVCVCACQRAREYVCVYLWVSIYERESWCECYCVLVCVWDSKREIKCKYERESMYECCMRENACECMREKVYARVKRKCTWVVRKKTCTYVWERECVSVLERSGMSMWELKARTSVWKRMCVWVYDKKHISLKCLYYLYSLSYNHYLKQ